MPRGKRARGRRDEGRGGVERGAEVRREAARGLGRMGREYDGLICAGDRPTISPASRATKRLSDELRHNVDLRFRHSDGRDLRISQAGWERAGAKGVRVVLVLTHSSAGGGSIRLPELPARLLPLADFITILDSIDDIAELDDYWRFCDGQPTRFTSAFTGPSDLFASFKDTHGVLIGGANAPDLVAISPNWGTTWRFRPPVRLRGASRWRCRWASALPLEDR